MKINQPAQSIPKVSSEFENVSTERVQIQKGIAAPESKWESFNPNTQNAQPVDPNALVQQVLTQSVAQTTEDLKYFADKVKYFNQTKAEVRDYLSKLREYDANTKNSDGLIDSLKAGKNVDQNVMEALTSVIKESAKASNEDKKYYLSKLQYLNKTAEQLSSYQLSLSEASQKLATTEKKDDDD